MSNHKTDFVGGLATRFFSLCLLLLVWQVAALISADEQILPVPFEVLQTMGRELQSGELIRHLSATLFRVICAFVLAMAVGLSLGLWMGTNKTADRWLDSWLIVLLNLPALVTIVLCYLWIGLTEVAAVLAVAINKIPMVTVMIREGARSLDPQLDALAKVFKVPGKTRFRHVLIPQLAPHIASSSRAGLALIWKIVLVVEFLGRPNGIGFQIHLGFQLFDVTMVLAYALAFIVVMLVIEASVVQPIERFANRWRRA